MRGLLECFLTKRSDRSWLFIHMTSLADDYMASKPYKRAAQLRVHLLFAGSEKGGVPSAELAESESERKEEIGGELSEEPWIKLARMQQVAMKEMIKEDMAQVQEGRLG